MRVTTIRMDGTWCAFDRSMDALDDVKAFLSDATPGETLVIEMTEMSQEEIDNMPEFTGW